MIEQLLNFLNPIISYLNFTNFNLMKISYLFQTDGMIYY